MGRGSRSARVPWLQQLCAFRLVLIIGDPAFAMQLLEGKIREGETVTVKAVADLDCDGKLSSYQSTGKVVDGELSFPAELEINDPLE